MNDIKAIKQVTNFGRNITFQPKEIYSPSSEAELLRILDAHRGRRFRAIGRLHSWSPAAEADDVLIDLRNMNQVTVEVTGQEATAEIGAGCQIKQVLSELNRQGGYMLNSLGLITEQTIAGATSTSTHGSGRPSTSHFLIAVRLAHFDPETGAPKITEINEGDDLRAARCSLGSLGIITSVRVAIRKQYFVEEHFRRYTKVEEVLAKESEFDLQQFFLMPWSWDFYAQHRREVPGPRSKLAWLYRTYWHLGMDIGLHLAVWPLAKILPRFCTPIFFRHIVPFTLPRGWKVIDRADRQLTMEHELFRHIEIELFVTRSRLSDALTFTAWLLRTLSGETLAPPTDIATKLSADLLAKITAARSIYQHHYPICIRRVMPDDALISMSSGLPEDSYAISLISYAWPNRRAGFFQMSELITECLTKLYSARTHWGKHCPSGHQSMPKQYPRWNDFAAIRQRLDPTGAFGNNWSRRLFASDEKDTQ